MTDREIRAWYKRQVSKIAKLDRGWMSRGDSLEQRARQAWQIRADLRLRARGMMTDPFKIEELRERDRSIYGSPDGRSFAYLLAKYGAQGLRGEKLFTRILRAVTTINPDVRP